MTSEELQRRLDELEAKRNLIKQAGERQKKESDSMLSNIRHTVKSMQKNVEDIIEPHVKRPV